MKEKVQRLLKNRRFLMCLLDMLVFTLFYGCFTLSQYLIHPENFQGMAQYGVHFAILFIALCLFRQLFRVYKQIWRYAFYNSYLKLIISDGCAGAVALLITWLSGYYVGVWQTMSLVAIPLLVSCAMRLLYQNWRLHTINGTQNHQEYIAIIGAGNAGNALAAELRAKKYAQYRAWCFVDTDPDKINRYINDLLVLDGRSASVFEDLHNYHVTKVVISMDSIDEECEQKLFHDYSAAGFEVLLFDFDISKKKMNDQRTLHTVRPEDLLFRHPVQRSEEDFAFYRGKTVLVTGGGGSIGGEICRQIAALQPAKLVLFDIYENNAYDIQQELLHTYGDKLNLAVEIGSVRDRERLEQLFACHRPQVVFHAAAHKHVPLMEDSPAETVKNNVVGTYNTADMAERYGVERFVLISSDKAVNPTNIMGASKRMCEMIVQSRCDSKTIFAAVRFGNVLGSNGSVIPLFKKQIEYGGPVTVTDKRVIRYFMTISEASQLVLLAGSTAKRGELFALDMGKPVKILDLAENMVRLYGLRPNEDIEIREIGLRPGEKMYEELLIETEKMEKTRFKKLFVEHDHPLPRQEVEKRLKWLVDAAAMGDAEAVRMAYHRAVPAFVEPEQINNRADVKEILEDVRTDLQKGHVFVS